MIRRYMIEYGWLFEAASGNENNPINSTRLDVPIDTNTESARICLKISGWYVSCMLRHSSRKSIDRYNIIYERGLGYESVSGRFPRSSWNVILIPQEYVDKIVFCVIMCSMKSIPVRVNQVQYGTKSDFDVLYHATAGCAVICSYRDVCNRSRTVFVPWNEGEGRNEECTYYISGVICGALLLLFVW